MMCVETGRTRRWHTAELVFIAVCVWLLPSIARAQSGNEVTLVFPTSARLWNAPVDPRATLNAAGGLQGVEATSIRKSLEMLRFDSASTNPAYGAKGISEGKGMRAAQVYAGPPRRMYSRDRSVVGLVLGAVAGAMIGGVIGVEAYEGCGCDDPTFRGIAIGSPIGASIGALFGYALVR